MDKIDGISKEYVRPASLLDEEADRHKRREHPEVDLSRLNPDYFNVISGLNAIVSICEADEDNSRTFRSRWNEYISNLEPQDSSGILALYSNLFPDDSNPLVEVIDTLIRAINAELVKEDPESDLLRKYLDDITNTINRDLKITSASLQAEVHEGRQQIDIPVIHDVIH